MTASTIPTSTITEQLTGAFTALITPFRNGEIDERALRELVEFQIAGGIDGLVPCGTTGESATMTEREHALVIETVIDQTAGRVPVIAGTGTNNTRVTIERTHHALHAGATAALVVVPYYNKPTQEGLIAHYTAIAEAVDLPLVLYNVPGRTGITMNAQTTIALSRIPTIAAIKEAAGNLDLVTEIVGETRNDFVVLSGDDSLTLPMISVGARGVISVLSNILPAEVAEFARLANAGQFAAAREQHLRLFDVMRAMFTGNNPTAVKTAAELLGLCSGEVRLPLTRLNDAQLHTVERAIQPWITAAQAMAAD
ncbi:MAG TPA: 4-hydroxy-tetrahydrodipicolinate synthase [Thermomicrobiales bacterium]|nr:4-hydroxy-tetrahydrodipicolinate synthase [Thermomicrobiales bacterium]